MREGAVEIQQKKFLILAFAPVMPCRNGQPHIVLKKVTCGKRILYCLNGSLSENYTVCRNGIYPALIVLIFVPENTQLKAPFIAEAEDRSDVISIAEIVYRIGYR